MTESEKALSDKAQIITDMYVDWYNNTSDENFTNFAVKAVQEIEEMKEREHQEKLKELREAIVISGDRFLSKQSVLEILDKHLDDKK